MVKTYMILQGENNNNADVLGYYHYLKDAKGDLLCDKELRDSKDVFIMMMQGGYFGEGFHQYILRYNSDTKRFKREYVWIKY